MPFRKFRSVDEMKGVRPLPPLRLENLRVACELTELAYALRPWRLTPGVTRFRTLEEANAHRRAWERTQVRRDRVDG